MSNYELRLEAPATSVEPPWGWWEIVKALLFIVAGVVLLGLAIATVAALTRSNINRTDKLSSGPLFVAAAGIYALVILAVYLFAVRRAGNSWAALGLRGFGWRWWLMIPILTALEFAGMAFINIKLLQPFMGAPFENPQIETITGGMRLTQRDLFLLLILVAGIAPIAEELLFRGMLYPVLRYRVGSIGAIAASAFVFGLVHFIPIIIPGLIFVGFILGWVRERSGSVVPGMVIHALQNGIVMVGIYLIANP
ncbi:MAG: type II CAAX endopeptidase family protein [Caldilineaceae bacterium]